eukprot:2676910-Pyramimonas_sp.AAC.1
MTSLFGQMGSLLSPAAVDSRPHARARARPFRGGAGRGPTISRSNAAGPDRGFVCDGKRRGRIFFASNSSLSCAAARRQLSR